MRYRKFGNLDWEVSILGFGTIRLPFKYDEVFGPSIDENNAIKMMTMSGGMATHVMVPQQAAFTIGDLLFEEAALWSLYPV